MHERTCMHAYGTYTHIHIHAYIYVHACMLQTYITLYPYIRTYICIHTYIRTHMHSRIYDEPQKFSPMNALNNCGTFNTDEAKPQKFSLHLDEVQLTAKLFSCLTFVVYGI